jgi:hypothetical protein
MRGRSTEDAARAQGIERLFTEASELARRFFMRKASRACDCPRGRGTRGADYANENGPDQ